MCEPAFCCPGGLAHIDWWEGHGETMKEDPVAGAIRLTCLHSLVLEKGSVRQGRRCVRRMVMQALESDREGKLQSHLVGAGEGAAHLLGLLEPGTRVV